jgi:hypothetical protein
MLYIMTGNHDHSGSTLCASCLESANYKKERQAKSRSYAHAYYDSNKDWIFLKKALERMERGVRVSRHTIERLHEAKIYMALHASKLPDNLCDPT